MTKECCFTKKFGTNNKFENYCDQWQLKVNDVKTEIIIFSKRKVKHPDFIYKGKTLKVVEHFKYLGVTLSANGKFTQNKQNLFKRAHKAMFALLAKCRKFNLPIDLQFELFDKSVLPILLYGSEIWGYENTSLIEKLHFANSC